MPGRSPRVAFRPAQRRPSGEHRLSCDRAREEQYRGVDHVLGASIRYGMGYGLFDRSIGWGGWGGSLVLIDPEGRMTVAYVMNQMLEQRGMGGDYRGLGIVMAAYEGLRG